MTSFHCGRLRSKRASMMASAIGHSMHDPAAPRLTWRALTLTSSSMAGSVAMLMASAPLQRQQGCSGVLGQAQVVLQGFDHVRDVNRRLGRLVKENKRHVLVRAVPGRDGGGCDPVSGQVRLDLTAPLDGEGVAQGDHWGN